MNQALTNILYRLWRNGGKRPENDPIFQQWEDKFEQSGENGFCDILRVLPLYLSGPTSTYLMQFFFRLTGDDFGKRGPLDEWENLGAIAKEIRRSSSDFEKVMKKVEANPSLLRGSKKLLEEFFTTWEKADRVAPDVEKKGYINVWQEIPILNKGSNRVFVEADITFGTHDLYWGVKWFEGDKEEEISRDLRKTMYRREVPKGTDLWDEVGKLETYHNPDLLERKLLASGVDPEQFFSQHRDNDTQIDGIEEAREILNYSKT